MMIKQSETSSANLVASLFKIGHQPAILTEGQVEIFDSIFHVVSPRIQAITTTQYGKSETVSMATMLRSITVGEDFIIAAPSQSKAQIIMGYLIDHCFDNGFFLSRLRLDQNETLDRLRRERSKEKVDWVSGGGVETLSLDSRNGRRKLEAAMGLGGKRIVLDESSLVDDESYATVLRMLGGYPYSEQFLFEIGNPFYRNHFYRSWVGSRHLKILVDVHRAIKEGRLSPEFVEEMREQALFDTLYLCKFPNEDEIDANGFRQLVTTDNIEESITDDSPANTRQLKLGVDVASGGDDTVFVLRNADVAWVELKAKTRDTMTVAVEIERIMETYKVAAEDVFVDDIGVGCGVCDRLHEKGLAVNGISVGEKPLDEDAKERFYNQKAQYYYSATSWIKAGGKLIDNDGWLQLTWIKYKVNSDKTIQIERKEELKKRTGRSPDTAEALMLTFAEMGSVPGVRVMD